MKRLLCSVRSSSVSLLALVPGLLAALGCASEGVDLGGGTVTQELRRGSRCAESTFVDGDVLVKGQSDVAALEGCQEVGGSLVIQLFADADLSPLHDLRAVDGSLVVGQEGALAAFLTPDFDPDELDAIAARDAELLANGWLESLSGLESLERAGALSLLGSSVTDLSALQKLRVLGGATRLDGVGGLESGSLTLSSNRDLVDLTGLEGVRGIDTFTLFDSPNLVSLSGLVLPSVITAVVLMDSPALVDLEALAPLEQMVTLSLSGLGVTDLSMLSDTLQLEFLGIDGNAALVDASALGDLVGAGSVSFTNNAALRSLPSFDRWLRVPDEISIFDNPALEEINLDFSAVGNQRIVNDVTHIMPASAVDIANNASLRNVTLSAVDEVNARGEAGLRSVEFFLLRDNPSLSSVDFGGLRRAGVLLIDNNESLDSVTLGELARVEDLAVTRNPQLLEVVFDDVATFERTLSGNAP